MRAFRAKISKYSYDKLRALISSDRESFKSDIAEAEEQYIQPYNQSPRNNDLATREKELKDQLLYQK